MAQEIEKRPTDIVGLQEVGRGWVISGAVDTMAWLSLRLDMPAYYGANLGDLWGNAVLTRLPVFGVANTHFNSEGRVPRGFQRIGIQTTGAPITILHTHLDHEDDGDTVRAAQVVRILEDWGEHATNDPAGRPERGSGFGSDSDAGECGVSWTRVLTVR